MCLHYFSSKYHEKIHCQWEGLFPNVKGLSTRSNRPNVNIVSNLEIYLTIITYVKSQQTWKVTFPEIKFAPLVTPSIKFAHYSDSISLPIHVRSNLFLNDTKYRSVYVPIRILAKQFFLKGTFNMFLGWELVGISPNFGAILLSMFANQICRNPAYCVVLGYGLIKL